MELHRPVGENAVALAHSLAGSSATVGFADLSQLARALEHALLRAQTREHGDADEARLFVEVADEIRHLLHQFAAGFLKEAPAELLERLAAIEIEVDRRQLRGRRRSRSRRRGSPRPACCRPRKPRPLAPTRGGRGLGAEPTGPRRWRTRWRPPRRDHVAPSRTAPPRATSAPSA